MLSKRLHIGHATVVAYASLFIALGGTGYAATQIVGHAARGHARGGGAVKVRCTARRGGKRVACEVVKGSGVGPRGPQGPPGPAGADGSTGAPGSGGAPGATILTDSPGWSVRSGGQIPFGNGGGSYSADDSEQGWTATNDTPSTIGPVTSVFQSYLLSPSEIAGAATHLASVEFCYGAFSNVNTLYPGTGSIAITHATVSETTQPDASSATPVGAPPAAATPLIDAALNLTGGYGCQTISASTPPEISRGGFLTLDVAATYTGGGYIDTGAHGYEYVQVPVYLGRVTTTYSP